jgi:hypothetical protein
MNRFHRIEAAGATAVTVLPITHSTPIDPASAVEIPLPVKRHLGLDDDPSWMVVAKGNEFVWPGYNLRKLPHSDRYDYGFPPPRFFNQVLEAFVNWHRSVAECAPLFRCTVLSKAPHGTVRVLKASVSIRLSSLPKRETHSNYAHRVTSTPLIAPIRGC